MAEHICEEHQTAFVRKSKGNKSWYAHPIIENGETVGWCNEDAKEVAKLGPQPSNKVLPEHKEVIDQAKASVAPPAPQAVGMMTKEIGDMIRAEMLAKIFGAKIAVELTKWYRSQALGITRINYDGKNLPVFK